MAGPAGRPVPKVPSSRGLRTARADLLALREAGAPQDARGM